MTSVTFRPFRLRPVETTAAARWRRLPAHHENANKDRPRHDKGCLVMAGNDGGVPRILAQKHYTQPSAFTPENLLREARRQKQIGSHDALQLIAIAADRLRSRLLL